MDFKLTSVLFALMALLSPVTGDFSLFEIQPITGFSPGCTRAYNWTAVGCNITNFFPPTHDHVTPATNNCTSDCRSSLLMVQSYIDQGCFLDNVKFGNQSVISHFLLKTGVDWLCGTKSGIAMSDLPLQAEAAPDLASTPSVASSIPSSVTLPGVLPPAKTSSLAATSTAEANASSLTSLPTAVATSVTGLPPQSWNLSTSFPHSVHTGISTSTVLVSVDGPSAAPTTSNSIATPLNATDAPVLSSSVTPAVNITSTSLPLSAAPTMVLPPAGAPTTLNSTLLSSTGSPSLSIISSTSNTTQQYASTTTKLASMTASTATAMYSNAAEAGTGCFALVLGIAAVIGFAA